MNWRNLAVGLSAIVLMGAMSGGWHSSTLHEPASNGVRGQVLLSGDSTNNIPDALTWGSQPFTIGWDGDLGTLTNAAVKSMVAPCTGHFTSLSCVATLTGACTTPPTVNVNNVTGSTFGTATVLTTTVGTPVVQAQTLVFTAGNTIGLAQTATPGTCTAPRFACVGTATCP